jgi:hypothetical protein
MIWGIINPSLRQALHATHRLRPLLVSLLHRLLAIRSILPTRSRDNGSTVSSVQHGQRHFSLFSMTLPQRFLNLKVLAILATLLLAVLVYFGARKVMGSDLELGMDRAAIIKIIGKPIEEPTIIWSKGDADAWEKVLFSSKIYTQIIVVEYDPSGKAIYIAIINEWFGRRFLQTKN